MVAELRENNSDKTVKCFVQLGKYGDIINICPILLYEFQNTGKKPYFLTSWKYGDIAARMPYVEPVMWDGDWQDLKGAVKFAKSKFDNVVVTQTFGKDFPIQKKRSSFALDAWDRAGIINLWDKIPLQLQVIQQFPASPKPHILFALKSQSSPFDGSEELLKLLAEAFPNHVLWSLDNTRLVNIVDCVSLYEASDLLVTIETAHLHLSRASTKPVIAFAANKPTLWHGSPYSDRFAFYCRYSEFKSRKDELMRVLKSCVQ